MQVIKIKKHCKRYQQERSDSSDFPGTDNGKDIGGVKYLVGPKSILNIIFC